MTKITRIEVIDENGRSYVNWKDNNDVSYQLQDDGRTLKVFVNKVKPKSPAEEAYKEWWGEYPGTEIWTNFDETRWEGFKAGYNATKEETAQEPEEDEWKSVALRFGEELVSVGPCGYYDFTPDEWLEWVLNAYEKTADEYLKLLEMERLKDKLKNYRLKCIPKEEEPKKPQTLYDICADWYKDYDEDHPIEDLVEYIVRNWLPKPIEDKSDGVTYGQQFTNAWNRGYNYYRQTLIDTLGGDDDPM